MATTVFPKYAPMASVWDNVSPVIFDNFIALSNRVDSIAQWCSAREAEGSYTQLRKFVVEQLNSLEKAGSETKTNLRIRDTELTQQISGLRSQLSVDRDLLQRIEKDREEQKQAEESIEELAVALGEASSNRVLTHEELHRPTRMSIASVQAIVDRAVAANKAVLGEQIHVLEDKMQTEAHQTTTFMTAKLDVIDQELKEHTSSLEQLKTSRDSHQRHFDEWIGRLREDRIKLEQTMEEKIAHLVSRCDQEDARHTKLVQQVKDLLNMVQQNKTEAANSIQNVDNSLTTRLDVLCGDLVEFKEEFKEVVTVTEHTWWREMDATRSKLDIEIDGIKHELDQHVLSLRDMNRLYHERQDHVLESIQCEQAERSQGIINKISSLDDRLTQWIQDYPLPDKQQGAKIYAIETRLREEESKRLASQTVLKDVLQKLIHCLEAQYTELLKHDLGDKGAGDANGIIMKGSAASSANQIQSRHVKQCLGYINLHLGSATKLRNRLYVLHSVLQDTVLQKQVLTSKGLSALKEDEEIQVSRQLQAFKELLEGDFDCTDTESIESTDRGHGCRNSHRTYNRRPHTADSPQSIPSSITPIPALPLTPSLPTPVQDEALATTADLTAPITVFNVAAVTASDIQTDSNDGMTFLTQEEDVKTITLPPIRPTSASSATSAASLSYTPSITVEITGWNAGRSDRTPMTRDSSPIPLDIGISSNHSDTVPSLSDVDSRENRFSEARKVAIEKELVDSKSARGSRSGSRVSEVDFDLEPMINPLTSSLMLPWAPPSEGSVKKLVSPSPPPGPSKRKAGGKGMTLKEALAC
eukprot:GILJ01008753.1.p1 GENE.GILJ01008753.1~~GILJ01008753.1.p1  ORF type:complete len:813 (+),score=147.91 GILJ01008753.1:70-2508(+)